MNIENTLRIARLIDVYGALLTSKQQQIIKAYIYFNGSLGEIADEFGSSRQAVFDLFKRTLKKLNGYEQKLKFCEKLDNVYSKISSSSLTKKQQNSIINAIRYLEE